jgi:hypothetical protein
MKRAILLTILILSVLAASDIYSETVDIGIYGTPLSNSVDLRILLTAVGGNYTANGASGIIFTIKYPAGSSVTFGADSLYSDITHYADFTGTSGDHYRVYQSTTLMMNLSQGSSVQILRLNASATAPTRFDVIVLDSDGLFNIQYYVENYLGLDVTGIVSPQFYLYQPPSLALNLKLLFEGFWNGTSQTSDTVKVYLASSTAPYSYVDSSLMVLSTTGTGTCNFTKSPNGSYYIVITHRNHLETWSSLPQTFSTTAPVNYDFSTAVSQAYGDNMKLTNGAWCLYAGDIYKDGFIDLLDMIPIDNDAYNYVTGWVVTDLNGDMFVDLLDMIFVDNNSYNYVGVAKPGSNENALKNRLKPDKNNNKNSVIINKQK